MSVSAVGCLLPILLAAAMAAKPHTALPSVNKVGMTAIFFTGPYSEKHYAILKSAPLLYHVRRDADDGISTHRSSTNTDTTPP